MLIDTGADVCLLNASEICQEEGAHILTHDLSRKLKGANGENVQVRGLIYRTVTIGKKEIRNHPFYVVDNCVVDVIGGRDLLQKLGKVSWDWDARVLELHETGTRVRLEARQRRSGKGGISESRPILLLDTTIIPPRTEKVVRCRISGSKNLSGEYLVDESQNEGPVAVARSIVSATVEGDVPIRLLNVHSSEEKIEAGTVIGRASTQYSVCEAAVTKPTVKEVSGFVINRSLSQEQQSQLTSLLQTHSGVFWSEEKDLGGLSQIEVECTIDLKPDAKPYAARPRRNTPKEREEIRNEIQRLLKNGLIRPSTSPWAAPVVVARKKDGKLRMAIDYRRLNASAYLHHQPLPLIDDMVDKLGDAKYFSSLDLKWGYNQMPLRKADAEKTAFVTQEGHYEWTGKGTPFGFHGAAPSFQRFMQSGLGDLHWKMALCYLDDTIVWGRNWTEHMRNLDLVLRRFKDNGLLLNKDKCQFGMRKITFLGHEIGDGTISITESRRKALLEMSYPNTVAELRRALGCFGYVQKWIPRYAVICRPLYQILKTLEASTGKRKTKSILLSEEAKVAFDELKHSISSPPVLQIPDMDRAFVLVTDASESAVAAMLAQRDKKDPEGPLRPVAFWHHALSKSEKNYSVTDREMLAIFLAVRKFRVYLANKCFTLITDHQALQWLKKSLDVNDLKGRRARWLDFLQQFDFVTLYRPGSSPDLAVADYLSRPEVKKTCQVMAVHLDEGLRNSYLQLSPMYDRLSVSEAQRKCPAIGKFLKCRASATPDQEVLKDEVRKLWHCRDRLKLREGLLVYSTDGSRRTSNVVVLPTTMRQEVLNLVHNHALSGHMGRDRTWERLRGLVWWPGMKSDLDRYVSSCEFCQLAKPTKHTPMIPVAPEIPRMPFEKIQVDFVGPFPAATNKQYRYVMAIQDVLTRYVKLVPTRDNTANTAAKTLIDEWVTQFDIPVALGSDNGPHFVGEVFQIVLDSLGIKHARGSPFHPQSQGQVERQNQLMSNVRAVCLEKGVSWPDAIKGVVFSHNTSKNQTTGFSPFELVFKQKPRRPETFLLDQKKCGHIDFLGDIDEVFRFVKTRIQQQHEKQSTTKHTQVLSPQIQAGDSVRRKLQPNERQNKLSPIYSPECRVERVTGPASTCIWMRQPDGRLIKRNISQIRNVRKGSG